MLNKDKIFLFERYSLYEIKKILDRINKRKLIEPNFLKTRYANMLINTYEFNYIRRWVTSLLCVISKKGETVKYNNYV